MQTANLQFRFSLFAVLIFTTAALAQDTATLTGTVRDNTGAVIPGATVAVTNVATGELRQLKTNSAGEYVGAALPPGRYDLTVTASGFRTYQAQGVTLRVAQNARIDFNMQVGSAHEEVTVHGEGLAQVNTQSSELGGTITGKELTQLQLNGRNFTQLITLVPGVSNQTGQDEGVVGVEGSISYSVNGGRTEYNNWEVDGGDMMDNGSNFSLNVYPSVEAIDEVQVLTSNYGAQYGKNGSGTVEVETKSGTNQFHGSLWEFARNEAFNAHNYFDVPGTPKAGYKKHDFGYSIGGPIFKNRTFFYWLQNWRREEVPYNFYNFVPSLDERNGNFSDYCPQKNIQFQRTNPTGDPHPYFPECPGTAGSFEADGTQLYHPYITNKVLNQIPVDPNGVILMGMIPTPNIGSGENSIFAAAVAQPTHWREDLIRVDHDFNSKIRFTFRAIHDSWDTTKATVTWGGESFPTIGTHFIGPGVEMVARLTATVSPTLLNEFVASYTTDHIRQINTNPAVWTRTSAFTMQGLFSDFGNKLPGFCLSTQGSYGGGFCEGPTAFPWENSNPTFTYRDNLTKSLGKHKLVFGGYFMNASKNEMAYTDLGGDLTFDNSYPITSGNSFADLLMGNIASFSQASSQPKYHINFKIFEPYFQDDYHISKNLTLNLGVRVSFYGTFWERNHLISNWRTSAYNPNTAPQLDVDGSITGQQGAIISGDPFDGMVQCGLSGTPRGCLKGHLFNPAPRLGFAWDPRGDGRMAIRGGYGIFFEHTNGMEANAENLEGTPPIVQTPTEYNVPGYATTTPQYLFPLSTTSIPDAAIWPYVQQWHFDIQHDLPHNAVATLAYVGAKGTHLTLQHELNQLPVVPQSQNPFLPGQPITGDICNSQGGTTLQPTFVVNGNTVQGQPALNLAVACGNDPDIYRVNFPGISSIQRVAPLANSNYNALQFSLRKTSGALTLDVAYTYSHSLDNSSDNFDSNFVNSANLHANYASSNYDQRHILTAAWTYDVPFHGSGLSRTFLGGWQYAGIMTMSTGTPLSVINGVYGDSAGVADGTTGVGSFADLVGDPHATINCPALQAGTKGVALFNCAAYAQTQGLTFGNSGRNSLNNPRRTNFDMSIYKVFKPKENIAVQFRAEAFNVFNHTQWNGINPYINVPGAQTNFLYSTGAHMPRVLQFALRITF